MAKVYDKAISEWRNMNQASEIAKEWKAFVASKDALVKAIRAKHGDDTAISFNRFSFGIVEDSKPNGQDTGMADMIAKAVAAALASQAKVASKVKGK